MREVGVDDPTREAVARHARLFGERFGTSVDPRCFFSPGRVNLMGAHLDYNGGPVVPTAIDRGTFIAVRPRSDRRLVLASTHGPSGHGPGGNGPIGTASLGTHGVGEDGVELELDALPEDRIGRWVDYPLGVVRETLALALKRDGDAAASRLSGLDVLFGGNLPVGAGLSSSASICVGMASACSEMWGLGLSGMDCVEAALAAEREFVGVQCGIMDPYAVGLARPDHLLWLDCKDRSHEMLPLDSGRVSIAVADTGVRRQLAQGAFNDRVHECAAAFEALRGDVPEATCLRDVPLEVLAERRASLDPLLARRAEHVLNEVRRTFEAREALLEGNVDGFGERMTLSHASLRELYDVSVPELDQLVETARTTQGVLGSRLTGAGFGGCAVILLERGSAGVLQARLERDFEARFGRKPTVELFGGTSGPREIYIK
jgi:galactokinase